MERESWNKIFKVQDEALRDEEYIALREVYTPAEKRFAEFWQRLPHEEQQVIGDYIQAAVALHHRLMVLACDWKEDERNAPLA